MLKMQWTQQPSWAKCRNPGDYCIEARYDTNGECLGTYLVLINEYRREERCRLPPLIRIAIEAGGLPVGNSEGWKPEVANAA